MPKAQRHSQGDRQTGYGSVITARKSGADSTIEDGV
jgi:hypothetical protein